MANSTYPKIANPQLAAAMRELICRWRGHNVDAITGVCHLCRQPILPPISST